MSRDELMALAGRVEALSRPCVHHDREIAAAAGIPATYRIGHEALGNLQTIPAVVKPYTASIDAAMTLAPEGWSPSVGQNVHHLHWHAYVQTPCSEGEDICVMGEADAATPALALTAAALRAIASQVPA